MIALTRIFAKHVVRRALSVSCSLDIAFSIEVQKLERTLGVGITLADKDKAYVEVMEHLSNGLYTNYNRAQGDMIRVVRGDYFIVIAQDKVRIERVDKGILIPWVSVQSSMIEAVALHGKDLCVRFNDGREARYYNGGKEYIPMLSSNSVGKYFNSRVRGLYEWSYIND